MGALKENRLSVTLLAFYTLELSHKPEEMSLSVTCIFNQMFLSAKNIIKDRTEKVKLFFPCTNQRSGVFGAHGWTRQVKDFFQ